MEVHPSARYATLLIIRVGCALFIELPPLCRPVERDEGDQSVSLYDCLELFTQAEQLGPEGAFLRSLAKLETHSRSYTSLPPPNRPLVLQQVRGIQTGHEEVRRVEGAAHPRGAPQAILLQEQVLAREARHLRRFPSGRSRPLASRSRTRYESAHGPQLPRAISHQNNHLVVSCLADFCGACCVGVAAVSTPPVYELYAVSNHYGSLGGGHYTAYAKNHRENKWYKFDDSSVSSVQAESVKTSAAYVLFYRLKEDASEWRGMPTDPSTTAAPLVMFATFWFTAVCFCAVFLSPRTGALTHAPPVPGWPSSCPRV